MHILRNAMEDTRESNASEPGLLEHLSRKNDSVDFVATDLPSPILRRWRRSDRCQWW